MDDIFKIAKQLRKDNQDVVGDKCVKDDSILIINLRKISFPMIYNMTMFGELSISPIIGVGQLKPNRQQREIYEC